MLGPTRPLPTIGSRVRVTHFGGEAQHGVVIAVHDGGRRLQISLAGDASAEFVLRQATAKFVRVGGDDSLRVLD
ncbi:MAG: hypothetical protein ACYCSI_07615 [Solirubrobacteraceae bacterium]